MKRRLFLKAVNFLNDIPLKRSTDSDVYPGAAPGEVTFDFSGMTPNDVITIGFRSRDESIN